jgi:hypothetical protein
MVMGACVSHPEKISKTKKVDDDDKIQVIASYLIFFCIRTCFGHPQASREIDMITGER